MSPLTINFNEFIDLTINPYYGTINITMLHTLLHLIIDQLKLSSCLVEIHGNESATIENQILCNKSYQCGLKVKQYEIKQEIDEGSSNGNEYEKGNRIEIEEGMPEKRKLFEVADIFEQNNQSSTPIGYPLKPIQPISIEDFESFETKVNSIHDIVASVMPSDSTIIKECEQNGNSMKAMIDLVNASKRIDALEIGLQQMANALKDSHCKNIQIDQVQKKIEEKVSKIENFEPKRDSKQKDLIDEEHIAATKEALGIVKHKLSYLEDAIDNIHCKCNDDDYEMLLFERFYEKAEINFEAKLSTLKEDIKSMQNTYNDKINQLTIDIMDDRISISESLKKHEAYLLNSLKEIQQIFNTKLNQSEVTELKMYIKEILKSFEEKIENIDCNRAIAAGIKEKIFKDITCISCGDRVIQIDDPMATTTQMFGRVFTKRTTIVDNQQLNLSELKTRICGGNHTITVPRERIFRSKEREIVKK
ncbi:unnamed protein product [Chironomus riparius]|uniref:DUF4795 domain-containing protein n=1 Tax=Chironomus riparius TaxID=315576 RepID=A0A9N9S3E6_9DIPT|nr:unnamed protein product [Chironomus riparius]